MTRFGFVLSTLALGLLVAWAASSTAQERNRGLRGNQRQRPGMQRPGQGGRGGPSFERMAKRFDANNDGKITRNEFTGPKEMFGRMDRDGDGKITAADFEGTRGGMGGRESGAAQGSSRGRSGGKVSDGSRRMSRFQNFPTAEPAPGQAAPNFELRDMGVEKISLSELLKSKPVVVEFGSFT